MRGPDRDHGSKGREIVGQRTCTVEVSPGEVDAGADLTINVRVACPHGCELTGQRVSSAMGTMPSCKRRTTVFDGDDWVARDIVLKAPLEAGGIPTGPRAAQTSGGVSHEEEVGRVLLRGHGPRGTPERLGLAVGVRPANASRSRSATNARAPAGWAAAHSGSSTRTAHRLRPASSATRPGRAPAPSILPSGSGRSTHDRRPCLDARGAGSASAVPHEGGSFTFAVKVVSPPDFEVTVEAFDSQKQTL